MSNERAESSMESEVSQNLAGTLAEVLEMIMEAGGVRTHLENLINVLDSLPLALDFTLQDFPVPEQSVSSFNTFRRVLEEVAEVVSEIEERDIAPEEEDEDEVLYSIRGIGVSILHEYIQTFEEMYEIMEWNADRCPGLVNYIRAVRGLFQVMYEGLEVPSRYNSVRYFLRELEEDFQSLPELDDTETPTVNSERNAVKKLIEGNTVSYKYRKIRSPYLKTLQTGHNPTRTLSKDDKILTDDECHSDDYEPPRKKMKVHMVTDNGDVAEECIICMCNLQNDDEARRLPCLHLFHLKCVDQWLMSDTRCPVCRHDIAEEKKDFPLHLKDSALE